MQRFGTGRDTESERINSITEDNYTIKKHVSKQVQAAGDNRQIDVDVGQCEGNQVTAGLLPVYRIASARMSGSVWTKMGSRVTGVKFRTLWAQGWID